MELTIIKIENKNNQQLVSARELHNYLENKRQFTDWIKQRIDQYDFIENTDYIVTQICETSQSLNPTTEYHLTLDCAKQLAMVENNEKGKSARLYFIEAERKYKESLVKPKELSILEILEIATRSEKERLRLQAENEEMKPKAEYFDALVDRNLLTNFRDTAKEFGMKESDFIKFMLEKKFIYRDGKGNLKAYASTIEKGLMEYKEFTNKYNGKAGVQTLITPKGRETFRLLISKDNFKFEE
jgi:anti-repressor protein